MQQITNKDYDERFYLTQEGLYRPSVTYVLSVGFPTNPFLHKWIGDKGWEMSQQIKVQRGEEGSRVHAYIEQMQDGVEIPSDNLSLREKRSLKGFMNFWATYQPRVVRKEFQIESKRQNYAGTVDLLARLNVDNYEKEWVIDFKTSKTLQDSHKLQIAAYSNALFELDGYLRPTMLVSLGNETKTMFMVKTCSMCQKSPHPFQHCLSAFEAAHDIFKWIHPNAKPRTDSFPNTFSLPTFLIPEQCTPSPTSKTRTKSPQQVSRILRSQSKSKGTLNSTTDLGTPKRKTGKSGIKSKSNSTKKNGTGK